MVNEAVTKFTWVIKNFSSLESKFLYSDQFVAGGCKWRLLAYPKGDKDNNFLSLYLVVSGYKTLPCGWKRQAKYSISIVNQISENLSERKEKQRWFDRAKSFSGFKTMIPLTKLHDKDGGFLVNNEVKIVAEVEVGKVIGNLDVTVESQEVVITQPLKKIKLNGDDAVESKELVKESLSSVKDNIDVNGFQVLPSQVEFVSSVFNKYPYIALELRAKNESLRTAGMYVFLGLIKTLCKSLQELSNDDLMQVENGLTYLKCLGIKLDWLEKKLEEVKVKKKEEESGETRIQELEEEVKDFNKKCLDKEVVLEKERVELEVLTQKWLDKEALVEKEKVELKDMTQKCSEMEALLEKEKANVLVALAPVLTLDEIV